MKSRHIANASSLFVLLALIVGCGEDTPSSEPGTGGTGTNTNTNTSGELTAGVTYGLTINNTWKDPDPSIGNDIGRYVPQFLLSVQSVSDDRTSAQVLVGVGENDVQDTCSPTTTTTATVTPFGLVIPELTVRLTNDLNTEDAGDDIVVNAPVYNLTMTNIIPHTYAGDFSVTMDMRDIGVMFHQLSEEYRTGQGVCDSLPTLSATTECEACDSDNQLLCLTLTATKAGAVELPGVTVQEVAAPCAT